MLQYDFDISRQYQNSAFVLVWFLEIDKSHLDPNVIRQPGFF